MSVSTDISVIYLKREANQSLNCTAISSITICGCKIIHQRHQQQQQPQLFNTVRKSLFNVVITLDIRSDHIRQYDSTTILAIICIRIELWRAIAVTISMQFYSILVCSVRLELPEMKSNRIEWNRV